MSRKRREPAVPFKSQKWLTAEYQRAQRKLVSLLRIRSKQTPQEKQMQKDLREIMLKDFETNNPECKFRFEHIEEMLKRHEVNPRPNIILVYGKKNIGKTWALARKVREMRDKDPKSQFVLIRNKEQDKSAIEQMFQEDIWPCELKGEKIYWKKEGKGRKNPNVAGFFTYSTGGGFQSLQGSSYDKVKLIVWDECNDTDGSKLTPETLYKFYILTSSIVRGKSNVEIYMMGNLLSKQDDTMNIFLSRMRVDPTVRLKFIDMRKDNDPKGEIISRLLYINALDEYKGIESQRGLASHFITEDEQESLLSNLPKSLISKCVYSEYQFINNFSPMFCLCYKIKETGGMWKTFILYIARKYADPEFIMWIDPFDPRKIKPGYDVPITNDRLISGLNVAPYYVKDNQFHMYLRLLANMLQSGQLWFGYNNSLYNFMKIWEKWEPEYESGRERNKIV